MAMKKPTIDYDKEADVLYVSFGIDEPSYCEPLNSFVLLELGAFTRQPTGFRVIQPGKKGHQQNDSRSRKNHSEKNQDGRERTTG